MKHYTSGHHAWVAHAADLTPGDDGIALAFRPLDPAAQPAALCLEFSDTSLRQWLAILYQQCERAEWPLPWPPWIIGTTLTDHLTQGVMH